MKKKERVAKKDAERESANKLRRKAHNMVNSYELDDLRFYVAELELHSVSWFSTLTGPHRVGRTRRVRRAEGAKSYVQVMLPVIHNYALTLALTGQIVETNYITIYKKYKDKRSPAERFEELGIYAYPLMLKKEYYKKILMSMAESDYIFYKPKTRLIVPIMTFYNALAPGTMGSTIIITKKEVKELPRYVRLGVKRYGIWKVKSVEEVKPKLLDKLGAVKVNAPFNVSDIRKDDIIGHVIMMKHYAGDIALVGTVRRALSFQLGEFEELRPIPLFVKL